LIVQVEVAKGVVPARRGRRRTHLRTGILFMSPAFLIMLIFLIGPVLYALYVACTNMALTGVGAAAPQWVGLTNFVRILQDSGFYNALRVSLTYLVGSALIGQALLGLLLALLMRHRHPIFKSVLGAIVVGAWIIPDVVAGFLWYAFLAGGPQSIVTPGLLNSIVATFGLPQHAWLQEYPMAAVIVANTWRGTAFSMLLYASSLEGIPPELYEAASIDGAGIVARVRHITVPLLKGTIATDLVLITLATLSDFTLVWVMTGGGPGFKTQLLTIYTYQQAFKFYELGYGTAISLLILAVGAVLSLLYLRILRIKL
jgi:multiple sugar transport system permease protein